MCFLIIGLIGIGFEQNAQAKTDKTDKKIAATKEAKPHKSTTEKGTAVAKGKKNSPLKKKPKAKLASTDEHKKKKTAVTKGTKAHKDKELKAARNSRSTSHDKKLKVAGKGKPGADGKKLKIAGTGTSKADGKKLKVAKHGKPKAEAKGHKVAKKHKGCKGNTYAHARSRSHVREAAHSRSHESVTPKMKPAQVLPVPDYQIHTPKPSDYYLSKDNSEGEAQLTCDPKNEKKTPLTSKVIEVAYRCLGIPYRHGGTTPQGFDCSGFVKYVFKENGIELGRSSRDQAQDGKQVSLANIRPGDLIFFRMHQRRRDHVQIDHVGLYVGNGQFIHATSSRRSREIKVDSLESSHYLPKVVEARRVLDEDTDGEESIPN